MRRASEPVHGGDASRPARHYFLWLSLVGGLAAAALLWVVGPAVEGIDDGPAAILHSAESPLDASDINQLVSAASCIFAAEARGPVRLRDVAVDSPYPFYTTDYEVRVTESLQGQLRAGDIVVVRQFGGSDGEFTNYVPGDGPIVEGKEYLFATRPTTDGLALAIFDSVACNVLLADPATREREINRWTSAIGLGMRTPTATPPQDASPQPGETTSTPGQPTAIALPSSTPTLPPVPSPTASPSSTPTLEPDASPVAGPSHQRSD